MISIPVRLTFAEYERYWTFDKASIEEIRRLLRNVRELHIEIEPEAGHNISLSWSALSHHRKILTFSDRCIGLQAALSASSTLPRKPPIDG